GISLMFETARVCPPIPASQAPEVRMSSNRFMTPPVLLDDFRRLWTTFEQMPATAGKPETAVSKRPCSCPPVLYIMDSGFPTDGGNGHVSAFAGRATLRLGTGGRGPESSASPRSRKKRLAANQRHVHGQSGS